MPIIITWKECAWPGERGEGLRGELGRGVDKENSSTLTRLKKARGKRTTILMTQIVELSLVGFGGVGAVGPEEPLLCPFHRPRKPSQVPLTPKANLIQHSPLPFLA